MDFKNIKFKKLKRITNETSKEIWDHLNNKHNTKILKKQSSKAMIELAKFMNAQKIMNGEIFLNQFSTTLENRIYLCYDLGTRDPTYEIANAVHEHIHVDQNRKDRIHFYTNYIGNTAKRAEYETSAYIGNMFIYYHLKNEKKPVSFFIERLQAYNLSEIDLQISKKRLTAIYDMLDEDYVIGGPTTQVLLWLQNNEYIDFQD